MSVSYSDRLIIFINMSLDLKNLSISELVISLKLNWRSWVYVFLLSSFIFRRFKYRYGSRSLAANLLPLISNISPLGAGI